MSKLKCDKHGRRVVSGKTGWIHRTGDGSKCDSFLAVISGHYYTLAEVHAHTKPGN